MIHDTPPADFVANFKIALVFFEHQGKILLLRRQPWDTSGGKWCSPGGGIHEGETPETAVIREGHEETGIQMDPANLQFIQTVFVVWPDYGFVSNMFYYPLPEVPRVVVNLQEHSEFVWVDFDNALKLDLVGDADGTIKRLVDWKKRKG